MASLALPSSSAPFEGLQKHKHAEQDKYLVPLGTCTIERDRADEITTPTGSSKARRFDGSVLKVNSASWLRSKVNTKHRLRTVSTLSACYCGCSLQGARSGQRLGSARLECRSSNKLASGHTSELGVGLISAQMLATH